MKSEGPIHGSDQIRLLRAFRDLNSQLLTGKIISSLEICDTNMSSDRNNARMIGCPQSLLWARFFSLSPGFLLIN